MPRTTTETVNHGYVPIKGKRIGFLGWLMGIVVFPIGVGV